MGEENYKLEDRLSFLTNRVASAINERFVLKLQIHSLTIPMWRVLVVLHDFGESKLVDLSSLTSIDASTLSRLTEGMHERKLIRKVRSTKSKREIVVSLRSEGKGLVDALIPEAIELDTFMLAGLSESDMAVTRRALRSMYEQLTAAGQTVVPSAGAATKDARKEKYYVQSKSDRVE
ncbi:MULTISPECIES: MarR family winged helix-turn-helix transcriptional regulator [Rhizobium]|jgi:DNA-binding MarR family transcriptional regulator|nr:MULTISPECIES: MarR family transcriptional regulator [Rhizobium]NEH87439.1 MarR family transcriptional regulator [Rhizobium ruizarguesonis]NEI16417.1 MarR family transcriptional regulator [Rhizobium ruizarguesonis]NEJ08638.1 MarR family transcriptional regulator [Rhizobium ruizarguesonis]NEJ17046.1 MarR family transcriptional regulator [Rhizobium ruizarguesonis]NEJ59474.1 MarR family transcriptional regulator [Rhizobium ruizarguesonis]